MARDGERSLAAQHTETVCHVCVVHVHTIHILCIYIQLYTRVSRLYTHTFIFREDGETRFARKPLCLRVHMAPDDARGT